MSLTEIVSEFDHALSNLSTLSDLFNLKARYLGKKGLLYEILKSLKTASPEEKRRLGKASQECKTRMLEAIEKKRAELEIREIDEKLCQNWQDVTLSDALTDLGLHSAGYHPLTSVQQEIEDIFVSMGFSVLDGPYIEDDYHNFQALNTPESHPARAMQDTFWFKGSKHLLRTHTSSIQVRGMEALSPPFKIIGPGMVFRCEATDASHESVFHQLEGMMVDRDVTVANLIYFAKVLLREIFQKEMEVRLRPGYFPFVEPGFEFDIQCLLCQGHGCPVCKQEGWLELLPCGMVHPNVLLAGGIDPQEFNGFAFGLGLSRLVMMRHGIDDVRLLLSGDLNFLSQFKSY